MIETQPVLAESAGIKFIGAYEGRIYAGLGSAKPDEVGQVYYANEMSRLPLNAGEIAKRVSIGLTYFLSQCSSDVKPQTIPTDKQKTVFTDGAITMGYLSYGSESIVFGLRIGDILYSVKTSQSILYYPRGFDEYPVRKDYIGDMFARNIVSSKCAVLMAEKNIYINPILIASNNFCIERFVEGKPAGKKDLPDETFARDLYFFMRGMELQPEQAWIWKNLEPDTNAEGFIVKDDGVKVWVDPFVKYRKLHTRLYE